MVKYSMVIIFINKNTSLSLFVRCYFGFKNNYRDPVYQGFAAGVLEV